MPLTLAVIVKVSALPDNEVNDIDNEVNDIDNEANDIDNEANDIDTMSVLVMF